MLRFAEPADAEALLAIYAQYIETSITFEYDLPTAEEFRRRIEDITATYPYLVYEEGGRVLGYAYAHRYRERAAYQWGAELSVYIDRSAHGFGLGKRLYAALIRLLRLQGVRTVYGVVTQPNEKSGRLHTAMGFTVAGIVRSAGYKAGAWHDVATYEKPIAPHDDPPAPLLPLSAADPAAIQQILQA